MCVGSLKVCVYKCGGVASFAHGAGASRSLMPVLFRQPHEGVRGIVKKKKPEKYVEKYLQAQIDETLQKKKLQTSPKKRQQHTTNSHTQLPHQPLHAGRCHTPFQLLHTQPTSTHPKQSTCTKHPHELIRLPNQHYYFLQHTMRHVPHRAG